MFDGPSHISPLIGTYCGQQRNLVIFSTGSTLLLTFNTLERNADTQNRGFQGIFNFSESYVKLGKCLVSVDVGKNYRVKTGTGNFWESKSINSRAVT